MSSEALLYEACRALGYLQKDLSKLLGVSTRTVQRWYAGRSSVGAMQWQALARAAHPNHPDLAARLAIRGGSSLEALGLVVRTPPAAVSVAVSPPVPSAPPAYEVPHLADGVVCVAAEAIELTPRAIRPALLAAFRRARQMRLTVEDLESALDDKPGARKARRKG